MEQDVLEKYRKAGRILAEVMDGGQAKDKCRRTTYRDCRIC